MDKAPRTPPETVLTGGTHLEGEGTGKEEKGDKALRLVKPEAGKKPVEKEQ